MNVSVSETSASAQSPKWPYFPKALLSVSRREHYQKPLSLNILSRKNDQHLNAVHPSSQEFLHPNYWHLHSPNDSSENGPLPSTLCGHVFIIGSAGSFDSPPDPPNGKDTTIYLPTQDGWQHMWSGDGMVYRLDFHNFTACTDSSPSNTIAQPGWASLSTRLTKTPDYYVDESLSKQNGQEYSQSKFKDAAITRLSLRLGSRNYLNTAWLPLKPTRHDSERLLVTWDAGRPYEIDPCSLRLVAPVGLSRDWKPVSDVTRLSRSFKRYLPFLSSRIPILFQVFPVIQATAHPVYDEHEDAVYLVNGTRSLKSLAQIPRLIPYFTKGFMKFLGLQQDPQQTDIQSSCLDILTEAKQCNVQPSLLDRLLGNILRLILWIMHSIISALSALGIGGRDRLFLYRWRGQQTEIHDSDKWEVVDERGWPIPILQSVHQMAITRDYIIISDSSYKFVLADILPSLLNPRYLAQTLRIVINGAVGVKNFSAKLRSSSVFRAKRLPALNEKDVTEHLQVLFSFLNYAQTPYTDVYVVPRSDLDAVYQGEHAYRNARARPPRVKAKHFRLKPETAHFLANYDNPDNKVVLQVGHIQGLDPAEFINKIDQAVCDYSPDTNSAQPCSERTNANLTARSGVLANSLAPNHVSVWTLDIETGRQQQVPLFDDDKFQLLALYTLNEKNLQQEMNVYWNCGGAWPSHHTINQFDLYKNQIEPLLIDQQINQIAKEGRPSNLLRISQTAHLDQKSYSEIKLKVEDYYAFPPGYLSNSPQFIPNTKDQSSDTNGYIICIVIATDNFQTDCKEDRKLSELWIFDAAHLSQGPLYRLNHPELNIGSTLHTAWLSKLEAAPLRKDYDLREDYHSILNQVEPPGFRKRVLKIFERDVFSKITHTRG